MHFRTAFWMIPSSGKVPLKQFITFYFNQQSLYLRTTRLDTIVWPSNFYRARDFIFNFYYLNVYILRRAISTHSPLKYSMQFSWVHCTLQLFSMNRAIFFIIFCLCLFFVKEILAKSTPLHLRTAKRVDTIWNGKASHVFGLTIQVWYFIMECLFLINTLASQDCKEGGYL